MQRKYKHKKIEILGIKIKIRLSYPSFKKYTSPNFYLKQFIAKAFPLFALILLFLALTGTKSLFDNASYATKTSPLLSAINPVLSQEEKRNTEIPPPKYDSIIFRGPQSKKKVALTFDADMTPQMRQNLQTGFVKSYYDQHLIDILTQTGTKATLFLSGMWIESYLDDARKLSENQLFELGNHTYSHPGFEGACYGLTQAPKDQKKEELTKTQKLLKEVTGTDNKLFRFPGGCFSTNDLDIVLATGQTAIQWDVAGQDGFNSNEQNVISNVVDNVKNGSIIVMHMNGYPNEPVTATALPLIIRQLKQKGYEFVTVSELLTQENKKIANVKDYLSFQYSL